MAVGHPFELSNQNLVRKFWLGYEEEPKTWEQIAPETPGISFGSEITKTFRWLELLGQFMDWTNLEEIPFVSADKREYTVTRKKWGRNVLVDEEEGDSDDGGMIYAQAQNVGSGWPAAQNAELASFLEGLHQDKTLWDGQYFFDGAHPGRTAAGVSVEFANKFQLSLTRANVQTILASMATFRYPNGELCNTVPNLLIVPPAKQFDAEEICFSPEYPDSANRGRNPLYNKLVPMVCKNLTDANRFYILDTTHVFKPIMWVPKQELRIVLPVRTGASELYVKSRKLMYSADAAGAFASSFWWWAAMSDPDISV